jgi:hypothetical protein
VAEGVKDKWNQEGCIEKTGKKRVEKLNLKDNRKERH